MFHHCFVISENMSCAFNVSAYFCKTLFRICRANVVVLYLMLDNYCFSTVWILRGETTHLSPPKAIALKQSVTLGF